MTKSALNCQGNNTVPITLLPAIRTVPLIFWHRCSCPFAFIKLVRYADANCPGGRLPVPVHVLGEELTACGTISELSRRISVIRSRNISMSCVFQNLAGLQKPLPAEPVAGNSGQLRCAAFFLAVRIS